MISTHGIGKWKLLTKYHMKMDVKHSATSCKGSQKKSHTAMVQTDNFQASKVHNLVKNLMQKNHHDWVVSCHPFNVGSRVKVSCQPSTPPIIPSYLL